MGEVEDKAGAHVPKAQGRKRRDRATQKAPDGSDRQTDRQTNFPRIIERLTSYNGLSCADVPLRNYLLTNLLTFYARKQLCFQRVLAIAILSVRLSVCPSVCHTGESGKNGAS